MEHTNEKCAIVLDGSLPAGVAANTAAILGVTLGQQLPDIVGPDVTDASGAVHLGIIAFPIPVLKGDGPLLRELRRRLREPAFAGITAVDFSLLAQSCRTYGEFREKMAAAPEEDLEYVGLGLCGPKKLVDKLTGSLPLLR